MTENANTGWQAPEGAQEWLNQMQNLGEQIQKQQQNAQQMLQDLMNTYMQMFNIPLSYAQEGARLAQEDSPGSLQGSTGGDPKEDQYRRSTGQGT